MNEIPFGITRDEILNLAAEKLAQMFCDDSELSGRADQLIKTRVNEAFAKSLDRRIDDFLTQEMERLVSQEIVPVDIWGEKAGTPTTIRAALAERARQFWDVKVDEDGKTSSWGGKPRHEQLMARILKDEFANAVKENAEVIVAEFKAALKTDASKLISDHIDKLIIVKSKSR